MLDNIFYPLEEWQSAFYSFGMMFVAITAGLIIYALIFRLLDRASKHHRVMLHPRLIEGWLSPARLMMPLLMVMLVTPYLLLIDEIKALLRHLFSLSFIGLCTWLLTNTLLNLQEVILSRHDTVVEDNLKARAVHTQVNVLVKIFLVVLFVLATALALMTFPRIRQVGFSILASAGIIGVIAGIAAQKSIANLIAGVQIAVSQPIRIDDVVIVEGEWGIIEKITLTYVVVRIWDLRRMVVPIIYFVEKPFQNWTHVGSNLVGTVYLHADYMIPVEEVRGELRRILADTPLWNGNAWALHVTEAKEHSLELRAVVSGDNAGNLWELRCHVREKLTDFVKHRYPECLPRIRADIRKKAKEGVAAG